MERLSKGLSSREQRPAKQLLDYERTKNYSTKAYHDYAQSNKLLSSEQQEIDDLRLKVNILHSAKE